MGKPHPMELRQRVVSHVDAGNTHRSAAARFDVSVKFVNDMVKLKQETGSLAPKRQGNPGIGKLTPHESRVREQVKAKGEITLDEMAARLRTDRGVFVDPGSVWRLFQRLGLTHTKTFKRLSKSVPGLPAKGMSGSRIASPLWRICWTASGFRMRLG